MKQITLRKTALAIALTAAAISAQAGVITFDDLLLAADSAFDPGETTSFQSGGATFYHDAPYGDCCWSGFTYSNKIDTTTPGYLNDMAAITGDGVGMGYDNYAVGFDNATLRFNTAQSVQSVYLTNTTYAYRAMHDGDDGNTVPFIKGPFVDGDFYKVIIRGLDSNGNAISSQEILLGDGTNIISAWTLFDLSSLGLVYGLNFTLDSSDVSPYGINTPAYFALDNLTISEVPVPGAAYLFASGLSMVIARRRASSGSQ